ncbi:phosphopantetheine-binding protein [Actinomadura sp. NPDC048394]|jgi:acyl carrier protein|uniref:phosphopantetheine-binding protein n=1 Tax=Actinomadura sp. NPDC048394 TaxID=3158223 RepID=UPI0033CD76FC
MTDRETLADRETPAGDALDERFVELLRGVLPAAKRAEPITPDLDLKAAGLDSMATIELLLRLENAYRVTLPDSALNGRTFATPAAVWAAVEEQREA